MADSAHQSTIAFRALHEPPSPGGHDLRAIIAAAWPAYRRWIRRPHTHAADADTADRMLRRHMPELIPIYESLLTCFPAHQHDDAARFLCLYNPPPVVRGCSQLVCASDAGPLMVRNYDHAPHLCDRLLLNAHWQGAQTLAMTDCIWAALDGINHHGLIVALAFGGRPAIGSGFAASLIVRYLLQTCATAADARAALARLPVAMAYTFIVLDAQGHAFAAYTSPDRKTIFDDTCTTTNHQRRIEWPAYAASVHTTERKRALDALLDTPPDQRRDHGKLPRLADPHAVVDAFLTPPLFRSEHHRGSGTLYTAVYAALPRALSLHWPAATPVHASLHHTPQHTWQVPLT